MGATRLGEYPTNTFAFRITLSVQNRTARATKLLLDSNLKLPIEIRLSISFLRHLFLFFCFIETFRNALILRPNVFLAREHVQKKKKKQTTYLYEIQTYKHTSTSIIT